MAEQSGWLDRAVAAPAVAPPVAAELRELAGRYARGADTFDGELVADCFLPDGVLSTYQADLVEPLVRRGRAQLTTAALGLEHRVAAYHHLGQCSYRYATSEAVGGQSEILGEVYCIAHQLAGAEPADVSDTVYYIRYEDRYVDTDVGWKIAERAIRIDFQASMIVHSVVARVADRAP
jgi:hypothetical protein